MLTIDPLQSILEARDKRALLKHDIARKGLFSLSLSLNIPGFPKSNPTSRAFFKHCLREFRYTLRAHQVGIADSQAQEWCDAAGDFFMVPCSTGPLDVWAIKQVCEEFEQNHPLGRFIDADLNDQNGDSVSSGKSKRCFFCLERPAIECRREKIHEVEELREFMFPQMESYCHQQQQADTIKTLTSLAIKAVLYEISLTPKPGLVDKISNGSHTDMTYRTFIDSIAAISPWFTELVRQGLSYHDSDMTKVLPLVRNVGLRMETAMFEATRNVNTQKGIIFLLGLSLFACGKLFRQSTQFNVDEFRDIIRDICRDLVKKELVDIPRSSKSHGEDIFLKYGNGGARAEAEGGFGMVFKYGLPQLSGIDDLTDQACRRCFLAIAANNDDTNILHRSNPNVLNQFKALCKVALQDSTDASYSAVIDYCKKENISPGGSADLLALTIFVWSVIQADEQQRFTNL